MTEAEAKKLRAFVVAVLQGEDPVSAAVIYGILVRCSAPCRAFNDVDVDGNPGCECDVDGTGYVFPDWMKEETDGA